MNNIQSLIRGVVSTLLFALGFTRVASYLDPLHHELLPTGAALPSDICALPCSLV